VVNVYLLIELLRAANAGDTVDTLKKLEIANCKLASVVALSDDKVVAELDCTSYADANTAILEKIAPVEGVVQTNIMAAVRPVHR
jgi:hypothetical protein